MGAAPQAAAAAREVASRANASITPTRAEAPCGGPAGAAEGSGDGAAAAPQEKEGRSGQARRRTGVRKQRRQEEEEAFSGGRTSAWRRLSAPSEVAASVRILRAARGA